MASAYAVTIECPTAARPIQIALTPSPYLSGTYFNQTLDLATASVLVYAGGTSQADAVSFRVWVDANNDGLYVDINSAESVEYSLSVTIESVRPSTPWTYTPQFASCSPVGSQPDVLVNPLPPPSRLALPGPIYAENRFRHASSAVRPSRLLLESGALAPGAEVGFLPGSVIMYHRNNASDVLTVNATLSQQGLASLVATTPDWWQDNTFGFALDSGNGPALSRSSASLLVSTAPSSSFSLRATAVAVQVRTRRLVNIGRRVVKLNLHIGADRVR